MRRGREAFGQPCGPTQNTFWAYAKYLLGIRKIVYGHTQNSLRAYAKLLTISCKDTRSGRVVTFPDSTSGTVVARLRHSCGTVLDKPCHTYIFDFQQNKYDVAQSAQFF